MIKNELLDPSQPDLQTMRPTALSEFIGQTNAIKNLKIFIDSAKKRSKVIDHILFYGPPGLGKTTLARIVANELGVGFKSTSAPVITKSGDLASILTNIESNDVLFIDEIHRLSTHVEEILYSAMEDFKLDLMIGEGPSARSVKIDLPKFTMIGATTRTGLVANPLRDRFGIPIHLQFYEPFELVKIVKRNANILGVKINDGGCEEIAKRSRGTPRICIRLLKRIYDFATVKNVEIIDTNFANETLTLLEIDQMGLDNMDKKYLNYIAKFYNYGPVGIDTISAVLSEQKDTLEDILEPYLLQIGFIKRTPRGRILTDKCKHYLNTQRM